MRFLQEGVDVLALVYAILFFPIPIFWLLIHPGIHFWRRFGNRSYWITLPVWIVSGATLVLLRDVIFAERFGQNWITKVLGATLVLLGTWVGIPVHRAFGLRRLAGLPEMNPSRYPEGIIRSGIYAYVRHPRYLGLMLTFLGAAFVTGAVGVFVLAIATILMYQMVAPLEERELRKRYGREYEAYAKAVPRFLPRPWRRTEPPTSS